jgi:hypothetical protein
MSTGATTSADDADDLEALKASFMEYIKDEP